MDNRFTPAQKAKIYAARRLAKSLKQKDALFAITVTIGPSLFGSVFESNSDTLWSRIENPGLFRFDEMRKLSEILDISLTQFQNILLRQERDNIENSSRGLPIGREKYRKT